MTLGHSTPSIPIGIPSACVIRVSLVIPVYRGASFLSDLANAVEQVRLDWEIQGAPFVLSEAIFVDDASTDDSTRILAKLQTEFPWIRIIQLSRNFGQHLATVAGVLHTSGDWVCTLDEDLQHPPESIPALLTYAVTHSLDVVYAKPINPVHESPFRDMGSRLFKSLNRRLTGNPHVRRFNSFRLIRGSIARSAAAVSSAETYYDIALSWFTNRIGRFPLELKDWRFIEHRQSGYNLTGLMRHARRMLMSSRINALRACTAFGFISIMCASVASGCLLLCELFNPDLIQIQGSISLSLMIFFFGGLNAFMMGVALEYLLVILMKTQGQPTFLVIDRSQDHGLQDWLNYRRAA